MGKKRRKYQDHYADLQQALGRIDGAPNWSHRAAVMRLVNHVADFLADEMTALDNEAPEPVDFDGLEISVDDEAVETIQPAMFFFQLGDSGVTIRSADRDKIEDLRDLCIWSLEKGEKGGS